VAGSRWDLVSILHELKLFIWDGCECRAHRTEKLDKKMGYWYSVIITKMTGGTSNNIQIGKNLSGMV
jgi:hypothetical protein